MESASVRNSCLRFMIGRLLQSPASECSNSHRGSSVEPLRRLRRDHLIKPRPTATGRWIDNGNVLSRGLRGHIPDLKPQAIAKRIGIEDGISPACDRREAKRYGPARNGHDDQLEITRGILG